MESGRHSCCLLHYKYHMLSSCDLLTYLWYKYHIFGALMQLWDGQTIRNPDSLYVQAGDYLQKYAVLLQETV